VSNADDTLPPAGATLERAFEALVTTLHDLGVRYAIIGGVATIQHTRVRTTDDIDALVAVPQIAMPRLFETLQKRGFTVDVIRCINELRGGLTTIRFGEVIVDLMRPVIPAYAHVLERAIETRILGQTVRISSPEGLIVMKLIAMRPQDEADVQDLLSTFAGSLDLDYVRSELDSIADANDPRRKKFERWVRATRDQD
jgi:predicted nucleotidyltransferase